MRRNQVMPSGLESTRVSQYGLSGDGLASQSDIEVSSRRLAAIILNRKKVQLRLQNVGFALDSKRSELEGLMDTTKSYAVSQPHISSTMTGKKDSKRRWLIRTSRPFRIKWDLFVIVLAVWNCFVTPYTMVFDLSLGENVVIISVSSVLDVIFFVDVLLTFRTTYFSSTTGDEIFDPSTIAKNYLLGKFWIDIISCFPNTIFELAYPDSEPDSLSAGKILSILGVMKLYRISRLNRIINDMRAKDNIKLALRIFQLMFFLVMYLHLVACALWAVMLYDETWLPSNGDSGVYYRNVEYQYWISFYASVQLLFGGEISPRTSLQACFGGIMILCGTFITANMFGNMAVLMSNLNMRQTKFQESHNIVNTAMKNMRLPEELQQRISDYLIYTQATMASSEEFNTFNSLISPSLYNEVLQFLYGALIKESKVFGDNDEIKSFILPKLQPQFCKPEEVLIRQGEEGERMCLYFLARGSCQVLVKNEIQVEKVVSTIHPATHFGEIALITGGQRTATVRSLNYATLAVLQKDDFTQLISTFPHCVSVFKQAMFRYKDPFKKFILRNLKRVTCFRDLSEYTIQEMLYSLKLEHVEEGDYIARPGQCPKKIYFLVDGCMEAAFTMNDRRLANEKNSKADPSRIGNSRRSSLWDLRGVIFNRSALKEITEMYPIIGPTGIEGSVHVTEKESGKYELMGSNCVEMRLNILGPGSPIGWFTVISSEQFAMQVKAISKCSCFVLKKSQLNHLRKTRVDLHRKLLYWEERSRSFTPLVDDYSLANDKEIGFASEVNKSRLHYMFRGLTLRVIRQNRDRKLAETPLLALILKTMKVMKKDLKTKDSVETEQSIQNMAQSVLKKILDPSVKNNLLRHQSSLTQAEEVAELSKNLVSQREHLTGER